MPLAERARHFASFLLTAPRVVAFLTVAYIAAGFVLVRTDYTLHNEGLLTHYWASWARQDFVPVFFLQKVKPVLCALYLPVSAWGPHVTLAAHVVVASLAIPMIASTARALGHRLPNLPVVVMALSPIYFFGGASGISNIDGAVGVTLVFYLLGARHRPLLAGLVAGVLPWVRFELAVFAFLVGLYALTSKRDRAAVLGLAIFPLLYAAAGAVYHADLLWLVTYPPAATYDPDNPIFAQQLIGLRYFLEPAMALTPAVAVIAALRLTRLTRLERLALIHAAVGFGALNILPIFHIGSFGSSPRYAAHLLPALALLLGRVVEPWWEGERLDTARLLAMLLLASWVVTRQIEVSMFAPVLVTYAAIVAAARLRVGAVAVMLVVALAATGPLLPVRTEAGRFDTAPYLDLIAEWLRAHPEEANTPIYTNAQLLAPFVEARGRPPGTIFHVAGVDTSREQMLINHHNGQLEHLTRMAEKELYGRTIFRSVTPDDLPPGSLLALRVEIRLERLFPASVWGPRLKVLAESPEYRIARLLPGPNP